MSSNFPDATLAAAEVAPSDEVFRGDYNTKAKIISDTSLKGLEDKNNTNPKVLDQFDDTAFGVGETDAFKVLSDEYEGTINNLTSQIDDYVAIAQAALEAIKAAIAQDQAAAKAAQEAADAVKNVYIDTDNDGEADTYSAEETAKAKKAAYDKVWYAKCWKPGQ